MNVTLSITVANERVTFKLTPDGHYDDVQIHSTNSQAVERVPRSLVGPLLDSRIRERIFAYFSHAPRR